MTMVFATAIKAPMNLIVFTVSSLSTTLVAESSSSSEIPWNNLKISIAQVHRYLITTDWKYQLIQFIDPLHIWTNSLHSTRNVSPLCQAPTSGSQILCGPLFYCNILEEHTSCRKGCRVEIINSYIRKCYKITRMAAVRTINVPSHW